MNSVTQKTQETLNSRGDVVHVAVEAKCQHCQIQNDTFLSKYRGSDYTYIFNNGTINTSNGEILHIKGVLKPLLPFGHILHQDLESVESEEEIVLRWAEETGLAVPNTKIWTRTVEAIPVFVATLFCSGIPLSSARLATHWFYLAWVYDNILEELVKSPKLYNYKSLMNDVTTFLSFLFDDECGHDEESIQHKLRETEECVNNDDNNNNKVLPNLVGFCKAMISLRKLVIETDVTDPLYFFNIFSSYIKFCVLESIESHPSCNQTELEYNYTKYRFQGLPVGVETVLLVNGLAPTTQLRNDPIFSTFYYLVGQYFGLANDLFSIGREISLGETNNIILVRARLSNRSSSSSSLLQDTFESVVNEINTIAKRILELKSKLSQQLSGSKDEEIGLKCINVLINAANAQCLMFTHSPRFNMSKDKHNLYYAFNN